jgi:chemotaxis protein histidine kinase CheA
VAGAMDSFKLLGNEIKGNLTKAFSTLKGGIAATGIGLLVIGLGLLIANFDKVKSAVMNLIPGLGKVADFVGNLINKVTDFIGVTNEAQRASEKLIAANEKQIKKTNEFLDANADKYDAYTVRKIKANNDYRTHENEILKDTTKTEAEKQSLLTQYRDKANREILASDSDRQSKVDDANQKAAEKNKAHNDKVAASNKAAADKALQIAKEKADKLKEIEDNRAAQQTATDDLITQTMLNRIKDDFTKKQNEIAVNNQKEIDKQAELLDKNLITKDTYDQRVKLINENSAIEQNALVDTKNLTAEEKEKKHQEELVKTAEEAAKAKIEIEQKLKEARLALLDNYASAVGQVADIIGKDTVAGKALAVAQALISTYTGISRGVALGFPAAIPAVISAAATGFGAVKNILATKIPGKGGGGGNLPAGANVAAAVAPLTAQAATTTLDQQSINSIGQASSRAFVLETDVTNNQERIARLNRAARIN